MPVPRLFSFDLTEEVKRFFDDSSLPADGHPTAVIIMGGVAAGKTTLRKREYSEGYVTIDAADIFVNLSCGEVYAFPEVLEEPMELIGALITRQALVERRNIVTEVIGADVAPMQELIDSLKAADYRVEVVSVICEVQKSLRRNETRGENNISAYYAERFQRSWIIAACSEFVKSVDTCVVGQRFNLALKYAEHLHRLQKRKGGDIPYIAHLLAVCALVLEHGGDEDQAIAALLHDAVEDQGGAGRLAQIRQFFGERVAEIVSACTDSDTQPKPPWKERKVRYIENLPKHDRAALLVSCADKLHNARAIQRDYRELGDAVWSRFKGGKDGTLWYYRSLVDEFNRLQVGPISEELKETVTALDSAVRQASLPQGMVLQT